MKAWLVNCVSLSVMILLGIPKRQTIDLKNLIADWAVTFLTGSTSGHFVTCRLRRTSTQSPRQLGERGRGCRAPRPRRARIKGSSRELELVDESALHGTGMLHTWLPPRDRRRRTSEQLLEHRASSQVSPIRRGCRDPLRQPPFCTGLAAVACNPLYKARRRPWRQVKEPC